jgi:hypothetical protein
MELKKKNNRRCHYNGNSFVDENNKSWSSLNRFAINCIKIHNKRFNSNRSISINAWNHGYVYRNKQWIPILDLPQLSDIPDFDVITPPLDV